jgi:putative Ca2+/H+ antiporter (TMEM165/GDT1 family)
LLNLVAVAVGRILFELVPVGWVQLAASLLFLYFGVATLRSHSDEPEEAARADGIGRGPAMTTFLLIFLAELGDKTQLVTAGLAAQHASPWSVFVGSTLALWAVSVLGVLAGGQLTRLLPLHVVHKVAGVLFVAFGLALLYEAWRAIGP